jgi:hypothetical protein
MKLTDLQESFEPEAERYAEKNDLGEISWAGSGDFGNAYYTEAGTILKVTRDKSELRYATMVVGKSLQNVAKIFDVSNNIIHMEELDMDHIEDIYYEALSFADYDDILEIDADDTDIPPNVQKFIQDVQIGNMELEQLGIRNADIQPGNIGKKKDGNYAIFDMSSGAFGKWE